MQFSFTMQIFQPTQKFTNYDCNIFFSKDTWFHLDSDDNSSAIAESPIKDIDTKSEHEPPEQYLET